MLIPAYLNDGCYADAAAAADRARPVLGAFFAPLLIGDPSEAIALQHAAVARLAAGQHND